MKQDKFDGYEHRFEVLDQRLGKVEDEVAALTRAVAALPGKGFIIAVLFIAPVTFFVTGQLIAAFMWM